MNQLIKTIRKAVSGAISSRASCGYDGICNKQRCFLSQAIVVTNPDLLLAILYYWFEKSKVRMPLIAIASYAFKLIYKQRPFANAKGLKENGTLGFSFDRVRTLILTKC